MEDKKELNDRDFMGAWNRDGVSLILHSDLKDIPTPIGTIFKSLAPKRIFEAEDFTNGVKVQITNNFVRENRDLFCVIDNNIKKLIK